MLSCMCGAKGAGDRTTPPPQKIQISKINTVKFR